MIRPTTISSILIETIDTSSFIVNVEEYCMHIGNDSATVTGQLEVLVD